MRSAALIALALAGCSRPEPVLVAVLRAPPQHDLQPVQSGQDHHDNRQKDAGRRGGEKGLGGHLEAPRLMLIDDAPHP